MITGIIFTLIAYLLGSINSSILIGHLFGVEDIRKHGSGNAGSTNVLRTIGIKAAALTFLFDVLKGVIPVVLAHFICMQNGFLFMLTSAFAVVIGHIFPVFFGFKGGKGVATSLGAITMVSIYSGVWWITPVLLLIWIGIVLFTRYVSLGSVLVFGLYPLIVATTFINDMDINYIFYTVFAFLLGGMGIFMHRKNIERLIAGTESKIGQKAK
ncbi:MAG: glycerol-3-phosphate 1-O-acyltransferase PlsY [Clostridia bacterium]|nr:glycerol-3-phosphate 1-O-acyltransferase PlsY [Clostridia bacterium]